MTKRLVASSIIAGLLLGGCAPMDGGSGTGMSKAQTGAILGGIAGAVIGKQTGNNSNKRAVIGGVLGAIVGAKVGDYMDQQEQELNQELQGSGVQVQRDGDNINLNMPDGITFDTNQAVIKPSFYPVLNDVASVLSKYNKTMIEIQGHTDNVGDSMYNERLSTMRANSVASALRTRGVTTGRMTTAGYGETMPITSNSTEAGRAANRRVEIKIIPNVAEGQ